MNNAEFSEISEALYLAIEDALDEIIDEGEVDLDYETGGGVLTIDCEDSNTKVIISRQQATYEIWVAAKSGGFHCQYENEQQQNTWRCNTTGETLGDLLSRVCTEQSNQPVTFKEVN